MRVGLATAPARGLTPRGSPCNAPRNAPRNQPRDSTNSEPSGVSPRPDTFTQPDASFLRTISVAVRVGLATAPGAGLRHAARQATRHATRRGTSRGTRQTASRRALAHDQTRSRNQTRHFSGGFQSLCGLVWQRPLARAYATRLAMRRATQRAENQPRDSTNGEPSGVSPRPDTCTQPDASFLRTISVAVRVGLATAAPPRLPRSRRGTSRGTRQTASRRALAHDQTRSRNQTRHFSRRFQSLCGLVWQRPLARAYATRLAMRRAAPRNQPRDSTNGEPSGVSPRPDTFTQPDASFLRTISVAVRVGLATPPRPPAGNQPRDSTNGEPSGVSPRPDTFAQPDASFLQTISVAVRVGLATAPGAGLTPRGSPCGPRIEPMDSPESIDHNRAMKTLAPSQTVTSSWSGLASHPISIVVDPPGPRASELIARAERHRSPPR